MWFWFSLITLLCWSGSDFFSKLGCGWEDDTASHWKMLTAVGTVMGAHALIQLLTGSVTLTWHTIITYLPVSALYIGSMALGYFGMRFIELSISSPICSCSGAVVAVLTLCVDGIGEDVPPLALVAVALVCLGVFGLSITEFREDDQLRAARQDRGNRRYAKSVLALLIPLLYCLLDALGTFADSRVLIRLDENAANVAYELTFFLVGLLSAIYVFGIKKESFLPQREKSRYLGAICETTGQFFYVMALADTAHVAFSAPIMGSYCVASVLWGRLFLKEKLSKKHYFYVLLVMLAVLILGILDL